VPGGTAAMAQSLGVTPAPEPARFVAELARLTHPSSESASTTRARAAASLRRLDWFEVVSIRGFIDDQSVQHFQVQLKVGFRVED